MTNKKQNFYSCSSNNALCFGAFPALTLSFDRVHDDTVRDGQVARFDHPAHVKSNTACYRREQTVADPALFVAI